MSLMLKGLERAKLERERLQARAGPGDAPPARDDDGARARRAGARAWPVLAAAVGGVVVASLGWWQASLLAGGPAPPAGPAHERSTALAAGAGESGLARDATPAPQPGPRDAALAASLRERNAALAARAAELERTQAESRELLLAAQREVEALRRRAAPRSGPAPQAGPPLALRLARELGAAR